MVIQLYTEMMVQDAGRYFNSDSVDEVTDYFGQMQKATDKILKLLNHLRNFSRKQAETKDRVSVNELIDDALFMVMNKILTQNIVTERDNRDFEFDTLGSRIQLEQVLMNIFSNACDAMQSSDEKTLAISLCEREVDGSKYCECSITDTGCGIPEGSMEKVFQSFYTTKKSGEGTGIGLSICNEILLSHDGKIEVESIFGEGTTFKILFPVFDESNVETH